MNKKAFAFEMGVSLVLLILGLALIQLGLPGWGLVCVAAILMGLSFSTRMWIPRPVKLRADRRSRGKR